MAISSCLYNAFGARQAGITPIQFGSDPLRLMLATAAYTPSEYDQYYSDVSTYELTGTNYGSGGENLAFVSSGYVGPFAYVDADDVVWFAIVPDVPFHYAILYQDTGNPFDSTLIGWIDLDADVDPAGSDYTIEWAAPGDGGILKFTKAA